MNRNGQEVTILSNQKSRQKNSSTHLLKHIRHRVGTGQELTIKKISFTITKILIYDENQNIKRQRTENKAQGAQIEKTMPRRIAKEPSGQ